MLSSQGYVAELRRIAHAQEEEAKKLEAEGNLAGAAKALRKAAATLRKMAQHEITLQDRTRLFSKANKADDMAAALEKGKRVFANTQEGAEQPVAAADEYHATVDELVYRSPVTWDDIGGMDETKAMLKYALGLMLARVPDGLRLEAASRVLLYGPPGTGKTLLAAACSSMLGATFFNVKASDLLSKWFGESTKLVSALFARARSEADTGAALIFIDEFDALCQARGQGDESRAERRILSTLLAELDGMAEKGQQRRLITIAATNMPWSIDGAILQRFEKHILVALPDRAAREAIFRIHVERSGLKVGPDVTFADLAAATKGYSGRHIEHICREAVGNLVREMNAAVPEHVDHGTIRDYEIRVRPLQRADFDLALKRVRPRADRLTEERYRKWAAKGGAAG